MVSTPSATKLVTRITRAILFIILGLFTLGAVVAAVMMVVGIVSLKPAWIIGFGVTAVVLLVVILLGLGLAKEVLRDLNR